MKVATKKVPLFPISAKKDTLTPDLLRSEPDSEKVPFFENSWTCMLTQFVKVVPPGVDGGSFSRNPLEKWDIR